MISNLLKTAGTFLIISISLIIIIPFFGQDATKCMTKQPDYTTLINKVDESTIKLENLTQRLASETYINTELIDEITELVDLAESQNTRIGVSFLDLTSNKKFDIRGDEAFVAASTIKVPVVMAIYDKISQGKLSESTLVKYQPSDFEGGTGILQNQNYNKSFDIETLCEYAIRYSDNIAVNMLIRTLDFSSFRDTVDSYCDTTYNRNGNFISPNGATLVLKRLYAGRDSNPHYAKILTWLTQTVFHDRLDRDLDYSKVAHKIGNYGSHAHDIGIFLNDRPYILSVYTTNTANANSIIAKISNLINKALLDDQESRSYNT